MNQFLVCLGPLSQTFPIHRAARNGVASYLTPLYRSQTTLDERLLQRAHVWTWLAVGLEPETFGF